MALTRSKPATQPSFLPRSCSANPNLYKTWAAATLWGVCPSLYASRNTFTNTFLSENHNSTREIKGFLPGSLKSQDALPWHWHDQNQQHNHHFYLAATQLISVCIKPMQQQHYGESTQVYMQVATLLPTPFFPRTIIVQEKSRVSCPATSKVKMLCHGTGTIKTSNTTTISTSQLLS